MARHRTHNYTTRTGTSKAAQHSNAAAAGVSDFIIRHFLTRPQSPSSPAEPKKSIPSLSFFFQTVDLRFIASQNLLSPHFLSL